MTAKQIEAKRHLAVDMSSTHQIKPIIVTKIMTRMEALDAAGDLFEKLGNRFFGQAGLLQQVQEWLTLPRFVVLPVHLKDR